MTVTFRDPWRIEQCQRLKAAHARTAAGRMSPNNPQRKVREKEARAERIALLAQRLAGAWGARSYE